MSVIVVIIQLGLVASVPISWTTAPSTEVEPTTVIPWQGRAHISGAYLIARINLNFINATCSKFSSDLDVAMKVANMLYNTDLLGATSNQDKQYGFRILKLETEYKEVLDYVTSLLHCSGRGGELWRKFLAFREQAGNVWKLLKQKGYDLSVRGELNETNIDTPRSLFGALEQDRPIINRQPRSPILVGLGLGFVGNYVLGKYFGASTKEDIDNLNDNIKKLNQHIRVTNERIDILAKNVSNAVSIVKEILDKVVEAQKMADIHYAIGWNLDQLMDSIIDIKNTFKFGELTVTLLEKGILNSELIDLKS